MIVVAECPQWARCPGCGDLAPRVHDSGIYRCPGKCPQYRQNFRVAPEKPAVLKCKACGAPDGFVCPCPAQELLS